MAKKKLMTYEEQRAIQLERCKLLHSYQRVVSQADIERLMLDCIVIGSKETPEESEKILSDYKKLGFDKYWQSKT